MRLIRWERVLHLDLCGLNSADYDDLMNSSGATCLGTVYGFIGKLHYNESKSNSAPVFLFTVVVR